MSGSYKVGLTGKDVVALTCSLPGVASIVFVGQTMTFTVGGVSQSFTFSSKGKAKGLTLKGKFTKTKTAPEPKFVGGTLGVTANFTGTFLPTWQLAANLNFDPTQSAKNAALTVPVSVVFNQILNAASVSAKLTDKGGKSGTFKH